ncbi:MULTISPECIES: NAD(P)H-binding protein [unclassified Microbacterium]|uniref:NAD(P)H-binding protein n=1 Tax=unclassified Microbacterium TaxID=2609290 RepID=UPI002468EC5F|nr:MULTISPECIES: NAD(P)H-binding protein [unclassified Microbacterium]MDH5132381.1 NAD(P)H-binding protein [Microbacterium sp. RD10]MDH5137003.1 NAD(P)H-binding protein [Microbacterium sp. RD11]MDH5145865.1 NAD(P)H-binding protein [Microbacterium sp. RD12]MDH5154309.1 NAD(P)H-binding protein [Microbacterium sp. RD06]MDH5166655.1 NAD(P)H-binding protein [Microbacterium sp. RD02]
MKVAITGGSGFVGRALADRLEEPVVISRRSGTDITDVDALTAAFAGCDAVAHCAGINREIGDQTFRRVHVEGTAAVVEAARRAGVRRLVMVSFLRARPDCGSAYHESKWEAEEIIRGSGLPHTILKSGMIYGPGDHMVDHVTRAVRTLPFFWTVGYRERTARPVPVEDAADVLVAALEGRIPEPTVAVMGADEVTLGEAIRRIARVAGRRPAFLPVPAWVVRVLAQLTEWTMVVPLVAKAQARMLAEGVSEPAPWAPEPPEGIRPSRPFDDDRIRAALPTGRFGLSDLRLVRALRIA